MGRVRGIEIVLDWSLLIIFVLVTLSLGATVFPAWHPDWGGMVTWFVAAAASFLFLASLLIHELAHALVGRPLGVTVRCVTLFIFGGMAHMEKEPPHWRAEFWMAIAGPLASLAIGSVCMLAGSALADASGLDPDDPIGSLAGLSPAATILFWLGPINLVLAVFNLLPGFPLDGGRILRSLLWASTGDLLRATRFASSLGRGVALALIVAGVGMFFGLRIPFFGSGTIAGAWIALIGWFLHSSASLSYRQLLLQRSLDGVPVSRLMQSQIATVSPELPVSALVDEYLIAHEQRSFPVLAGDALVGLVGYEQVRKLAPLQRLGRTVGEIMTPVAELPVIAPTAAVTEALGAFPQQSDSPLPVVVNGQLRGLLRREDVQRWLALRGEGPTPA